MQALIAYDIFQRIHYKMTIKSTIYEHLVHESLQVKGRDITEEERKMLEEEGVNIPYNVILTKVCFRIYYFISLFWIFYLRLYTVSFWLQMQIFAR